MNNHTLKINIHMEENFQALKANFQKEKNK